MTEVNKLLTVYLSMETPVKSVLVIGASPKEERYSYKAVNMLVSHGHDIVLMGLRDAEVAGERILKTADQIESLGKNIDTFTIYLGPQNQGELLEYVSRFSPRRIIFNPGTENPAIYSELESRGVEVEEACTLVLLSTDQF